MFYGWRMVGVAFFAHFVASGLSFYALPRLLVPLAEHFSGGERSGVALLVAAMSLPGLVVSPVVGLAVSRIRLRVVLSCGAVVLGIGFALASRVEALWQLAVIYAVALPFGVTAMSGIGANALVTNWFDRRRPIALGTAQFGLSLSGAAATFFIGWTLANGGWRGTYVWFSGIALAAAPLLWLAIRDRPSDLGLAPDGDPVESSDAGPATAPPFTMKQAFGDRDLWLVGLAAGLCFAATTAVLQNIHALATDAGHSATRADTVLAALAIGAAFGKLLFGALGVRLGERTAFVVAIVGQGVGVGLLPAASHSFPLLIGLVVSFGLALGGLMPSLAALLARLYGPLRFGPVMGYVGPLLIPFQMIGAPVAAWVYDETGSYDLALYGFVLCCMAAAVLLTPVRMHTEAQETMAAT